MTLKKLQPLMRAAETLHETLKVYPRVLSIRFSHDEPPNVLLPFEDFVSAFKGETVNRQVDAGGWAHYTFAAGDIVFSSCKQCRTSLPSEKEEGDVVL